MTHVYRHLRAVALRGRRPPVRGSRSSCDGGADLFPVFDSDTDLSNNRMGYIDSGGRQVIGFDFFYAEGFIEGPAAITWQCCRNRFHGYNPHFSLFITHLESHS